MFTILRTTGNLKILCATVCMRVLHLFIVKSYFVPDEYWQSVEIAHRTAFGYGYVTWEWDKAIRSFFYPFWISLIYYILGFLKLDYPYLLILLPRILQLLLSLVADFYLWLWLNKPQLKLKKEQVQWAYFMWLSCFLVNYCSTRTLTNTAEMNFSVIALYYYPWSNKQSSRQPNFLWFVGFACLARPTAFIMWTPLCIYDLFFNSKTVNYFMSVYLNIMIKIALLSVLVDLIFYKRIVLTPLNFILYNGQYNIGAHYGVHSWYWYIGVGIPAVIGPIFILFYYSVFKISTCLFFQVYKYGLCNRIIGKKIHNIDILLVFTVVWTIFWYTLVPHKEFRFILPLAPLMIYFSALNLNVNSSEILQNKLIRRFFLCISISAVTINICGLLYLGLWHQSGPLTVISKLAHIAQESPDKSNFLFLTPCHSTPLYSHIHVNISTKILTCEPNLDSVELYKDESDIFFGNPLQWLNVYVRDKSLCTLPSHIIFFSNLKPYIEKFLDFYNYTELDVIFHSHFTQGRQSQYIEIFHLAHSRNC